jgi:enoyl-CoA hydratase/carnithine racemase
MSTLVQYRVEGDMAVLRLNRPERNNSLVPELLQGILAQLDVAKRDERVRAVVLSHTGRSFSSGGDVEAFAAQGEGIRAYAETLVGLLNCVILRLVTFPKPTLAAVDGVVSGGSLGLVLGCDIVVVSERASFTPYYVDVGFSPDGGWTALLPERIGAARAAAVQLSNNTITASQALQWGMVAQMAKAGVVESDTLHTARQIADKWPGSVAATRRLLRPDPKHLAEALERERVAFVARIVTDEARRGMQQFLSRQRMMAVAS